jgi:3-hydroxybutyrate dehydrogenase
MHLPRRSGGVHIHVTTGRVGFAVRILLQVAFAKVASMHEPLPLHQAPDRALSGKTAIVTGSTSGIGLGIAQGLAAAGANIVLNGMGSEADIEDTRAAIAGQHGVSVAYSNADIGKPERIADLVNLAEDRFGGVDILVNNAGIQYVAPIEDFPAEKWDAIIAINLSGAFHASRLAVPGMKRKGWGRIINIASAHALVASPFKSAYVAAKHGIAGLTKTIALELAEHGITANAICPGYVMTPLVLRQIPEQAAARSISEDAVIRDVLLAAQPTKRFVETAELTALAVFLCSNEARSITGTLLPVDGGWTAH